MKKVLTVLACVLLVAALAVSAFAAIQDGKVELKASATELQQGDTFTVEAYLTNKEDLTLCTVVLDYDTSVLELTGGASHVPGASMGLVVVKDKAGTAVLQTPAAFEGKVFTFNFTVKADAKFGDCKINAAASIGNGTGNDITAEGTSVKVVCKDHAWADKAEAAYLKSEATCTEKAVYYKSCSKCGEKGTATFTEGAALGHDWAEVQAEKYLKEAAKCGKPASYYKSCSRCEVAGTETFTVGEAGAHQFTEEKVDAKYLKSEATCTAKAVYYKSCECGEKGTETFETGAMKAHTLTNKVEAGYLKSEATCTAKAVYYKSCSVCGYKADETFETGDMLAHTYAQKAEDKYLKTEATCQKKATYVESCSVCGAAGTVTFEAGELAAHTFKTWEKVDAQNHKSTCAVAGCTAVETKAHEFAAELTAGEKTHWNECVCGEKANEVDHVFDEKKWEKDETNHWHACACGAKSGEAKHAWDEGKVTKEPTTKAEGEKTYTCKDCAGVKVEKLDKLASPKTGDESFLLIVTMLVAMSACGVAAVLVLKKRQAR